MDQDDSRRRIPGWRIGGVYEEKNICQYRHSGGGFHMDHLFVFCRLYVSETGKKHEASGGSRVGLSGRNFKLRGTGDLRDGAGGGI